MRRWDVWSADHIRFTVTGRGAQHFLSAAAGKNVKLQNIRCTSEGYAASAAGADRPLLQELAAKGGWQFTVQQRHGPGHWLERLLARPGLSVGAVLFLVLLRLLTGFVWAMDFGELETGCIPELRALLAQYEIWEGAWLTRETMARAQNALSAQSETFGWISLNFTGGCLLVESAPAGFQPVQPAPTAAALVAKAGGEVLAVEVESGFAQVRPGQYVVQGQELASSQKADRSGNPVTQDARGRVLARVVQRVTAQVPLQQTVSMLTGRRTQQNTLHCLGITRSGELPEVFAASRRQVEWIPLTVGRLALPGCLYRVTWWEEAEQTVRYTPETALALARRDCRLQVAQLFPDAVIEQETFALSCTGGTAICTADYVLVADIAVEAS